MASDVAKLHLRNGFGPGVLRARSKSKEKSGAASEFGFGPDLAAVAMNDALHRRQPDAGALEIFLPVKALKDSEQLIGIFRIEAHSVIAHKENRRIARFLRTYLNNSELPRLGEFGGIGEKINEN